MLFKTTAALGATLFLIAPLGAGADSFAPPTTQNFAPPAHALAHGARRRPHDSSDCSLPGPSSFIGGGTSNNAYGSNTAVLGGQANSVCDDWSTISGGDGNSISTSGFDYAFYSFIGGGSGNTVTNLGGFIGSGASNAVSSKNSGDVSGFDNSVSGNDGFIGAGESDMITSSTAAVIGGGLGNKIVAENVNGTVNAGGSYSFIGGGESNAILGAQEGAAMYASIAGGIGNMMTGLYGTIAGGYDGDVSGTAAAIGGGEQNVASGVQAAIAGGSHNLASNLGAFVGGGSGNSATGQFSTIPGGYLNAANGIGSFAAGTQAKARTNGAFVWSDNSSNTELQSTAPYQFMARAAGGFYLYSNATASSGVKLAPGSGAWSMLSDRTMKNDIVPLDDAAVLAKVAALPVSEWSYNSERGVRHVGPMAQDFYAAFRVGEDDRHITSIDEDGVALAAIKALHAENASLHAENASLHAETVSLKDETASLRRETLALRGDNASLAAGIAVIGEREAALQREVSRLAPASRAARVR